MRVVERLDRQQAREHGHFDRLADAQNYVARIDPAARADLRIEPTRFEVLVTDEDRDQNPDQPWLAQIRDVSDGPSDDVVGAAYGRSLREAIHRAADAIATVAHEHEEQR